MLSDFAEKKETFFDLKKQHFSKSIRSLFFKGVNPYFLPKNANFILNLNLIKISLEIMLSDFAEKRETFLTIKNRIFQSPKDRIFFQTGRTHAFGQKMPFFSLLDLIKITLQIMLSDFAVKKETFFDLKKQHFSKSKKSLFFKGVNPYFLPKNANFILNLNLIKISLEIMLSDFAEKRETFLTLKDRIFQSPKNALFQRG